MDVLIRDLPADVHAQLARRAAAADMSLRAYLQQVLTEHVTVPSMQEWLQGLDDLRPVDPDGPTGPELIAAGRADDDELPDR